MLAGCNKCWATEQANAVAMTDMSGLSKLKYCLGKYEKCKLHHLLDAAKF